VLQVSLPLFSLSQLLIDSYLCAFHPSILSLTPKCFPVEHVHSLKTNRSNEDKRSRKLKSSTLSATNTSKLTKMKSFLAIPALFALGALADAPSGWGFTWTFSSGHSTWTSATQASNATVTSTEVAAATTASWSEWLYTTSYNATFSSGASTWAVPTAVSYSEAQNFTSMIPAPTTPVSSSVEVKTTSTAATTSTGSGAATTPSAFPGAAVNEKVVGLGALAVAGLALVL
jgi:hypothetical protein